MRKLSIILSHSLIFNHIQRNNNHLDLIEEEKVDGDSSQLLINHPSEQRQMIRASSLIPELQRSSQIDHKM